MQKSRTRVHNIPSYDNLLKKSWCQIRSHAMPQRFIFIKSLAICIIFASVFAVYNWAFTPYSCATPNTIYISAGAFGNLFDEHPFIGNTQISCARLKKYLNAHEYNVQQIKNARYLANPQAILFFDIYTNLLDLQAYPLDKRVLFLWEPPTTIEIGYKKENHQYFSRIYTWNDDLVDNKKYFKFYYPQPTLKMVETAPDYAAKKLCTLIGCNKHSYYSHELYSERKKAIEFFETEHPESFEFYGVGWDPNQYKTYKGTIKDKIEYLKKYKFSICYENASNLNGYITEKIFDCFVAGCIPIYWGAPNIAAYIPKSCFIDRRDFNSLQELYAHLISIDRTRYQEYLTNIATFLKSKDAQLFSSDHFITTVFGAACPNHTSMPDPKYATA